MFKLNPIYKSTTNIRLKRMAVERGPTEWWSNGGLETREDFQRTAGIQNGLGSQEMVGNCLGDIKGLLGE